MPKDYKIGMLCGVVLAIIAGLLLSLHPGLSIRASIEGSEKSEVKQEPIERVSVGPSPPADSLVEKETEIERQEPKTVKSPRYHTVSSGETLSSISFQYYGTEHKWQKILDANRDVIHDVNRLRLGIRLIIPE
jgi:nucleoid-associated protein YgaU